MDLTAIVRPVMGGRAFLPALLSGLAVGFSLQDPELIACTGIYLPARSPGNAPVENAGDSL